MKVLFAFLCCLPLLAYGQVVDTAVAVQDTTIYDLADEKPRFPTPCETVALTVAQKDSCAQAAVLAFVNQRAYYTAEARAAGVSGLAVVGFVIEKDGLISRVRILRDPGAGLGLSAIGAVIDMAKTVRWRPAMREGEPVRFRYVLPVRFRIEEPLPYVVSGPDTIYTELTKPIVFTGSEQSPGAFLAKQIEYPAVGEDSCQTGQLDVQILVRPDGSVGVQDIIDYNDLGTDFTFAATTVVTSSLGQWQPAEYDGQAVTAAYDLSFVFAPTRAACAETVMAYNRALRQMDEAVSLLQDTTTVNQALEQMDQAVAAFPADGRFRVLRGQARMNNNRLAGACEDLRMARSIALIDWFDGVLPLLCRGVEE